MYTHNYTYIIKDIIVIVWWYANNHKLQLLLIMESLIIDCMTWPCEEIVELLTRMDDSGNVMEYQVDKSQSVFRTSEIPSTIPDHQSG